ncbi:class I SAM-dependent methyltransferase [Chloroflexota bacterium]
MHKENGQPSKFLAENIRILPIGRALDIAMGSGHNAVFLAQMGFDVRGIDISAEAVNNALDLAKEFNVVIKAEVVDLESDFTIKKGYYDVIICFNYLQRSLIPQIKDGLRPGGMIVYETFIAEQATLFGKPKNPDFLLKHNELLDMFRDFRCLRYREGIIEDQKAAASILAEKI